MTGFDLDRVETARANRRIRQADSRPNVERVRTGRDDAPGELNRSTAVDLPPFGARQRHVGDWEQLDDGRDCASVVDRRHFDASIRTRALLARVERIPTGVAGVRYPGRKAAFAPRSTTSQLLQSRVVRLA